MRIIRMRQYRRGDGHAAVAFLAPALLLLGIFLITPFVMALVLSFTDARLLSPLPTRFVGLSNYLRLIADDRFWQAFQNTFTFAAIVVPTQSSLALFLATLINRRLPGINLFRAIYFMPVVINMVVVSVVWYFLLLYPQGMINSIVQAVTFGQAGPYNFFANPALAFPMIMLLSIWQGAGFQMVIYLAGLQGIPRELYEAARVDGASAWQQFWHVTMPGLRNTHIFVVVVTTILAFKLFTQVQVLTQGGPLGTTNTLVRYLFVAGYREMRLGYAAAAAVIFLLVVLAISLIQRRLLVEEREVR